MIDRENLQELKDLKEQLRKEVNDILLVNSAISSEMVQLRRIAWLMLCERLDAQNEAREVDTSQAPGLIVVVHPCPKVDCAGTITEMRYQNWNGPSPGLRLRQFCHMPSQNPATPLEIPARPCMYKRLTDEVLCYDTVRRQLEAHQANQRKRALYASAVTAYDVELEDDDLC
jgi:hypothetical protein